MNMLWKLIAVTLACTLSTSQAFALSCRTAHIAPQLDFVLEQAAQFEAEIKEQLEKRKSPDELRIAALRLQKLEGLIETILDDPVSQTLRAAVFELNNFKGPLSLERLQAPTAVVPLKHQIVILRKADKDIENLQTYLKIKLQNFIKESSQVNSLGELSASWALERVEVDGFPRGQTYSIELNQGYRVVFTYSTNPKTITFHRISKRVTH